MDRIEEIWDKGNKQIAGDDSFSSDAILKSISENSVGITSGLLKTLWFGVIIAAMAVFMFIWNIFPYAGNPGMLVSIIACLVVAVTVIIYLLSQIRILKKMDMLDLTLNSILGYKIKYLNTKYILALHCVSLSIVLATFTINLTIEGGDGIFELRKILILSTFYLFVYIVSFSLSMLTHKVNNRQLKNALFDLEENRLRSIDNELKRQRRVLRVILVIVAVILSAGVVALLLVR